MLLRHRWIFSLQIFLPNNFARLIENSGKNLKLIFTRSPWWLIVAWVGLAIGSGIFPIVIRDEIFLVAGIIAIQLVRLCIYFYMLFMICSFSFPNRSYSFGHCHLLFFKHYSVRTFSGGI
jgi:hypothetical protein